MRFYTWKAWQVPRTRSVQPESTTVPHEGEDPWHIHMYTVEKDVGAGRKKAVKIPELIKTWAKCLPWHPQHHIHLVSLVHVWQLSHFSTVNFHLISRAISHAWKISSFLWLCKRSIYTSQFMVWVERLWSEGDTVESLVKVLNFNLSLYLKVFNNPNKRCNMQNLLNKLSILLN